MMRAPHRTATLFLFSVTAAWLIPFSTPAQGQATRRAKRGSAPPRPAVSAAAASPRSVAALGFAGKLGPNDEGFVPGFESFKLRFGPGDWAGGKIDLISAWGDKDTNGDLWGWAEGRETRCTDILSDRDGAHIIVSLATAGAPDWIGANFRYTLRDGRRGVANALFPFQGNPKISQETVAALGFEGRLDPGDEGYAPEFESYKLRLGPGDWAETRIMVSSNWGEGTAGADLWGWKDGAETNTSEVRRDGKGYYLIHSIRSAGHSRWVAALFRFERKDGRTGVARALFSYSGALSIPKPAGQMADVPTAPPAPAPSRPKPTARTLAAARPTAANLKYLRSLTDEFNDATLDDLVEMTELDLNDKLIDDEGMVHLRGLRRLETLSLQNTRVGDAGLENIAGLSALRRLNLINTPTTDAGLATVGRLPALTHLNLDLTLVTDAGLRSLGNLKRLEVLTLSTTDVGDAGLAALAALPELMSLNIGKTPDFESERITPAGLAQLQKLPQLEQLVLAFVDIGDDGLAQLRGIPRLALLDLTGAKFTDAGLAGLRGMPELAQIDLSQTPVTGAGLAPLKTMPKLKYLLLGFSDIGDEGMAHIGDLKNLELLSIVKGNITDAGLAHLRGLTQLDRLHLPDNAITGAGVANLRGLTQLYQLNLYANELDDASLAVIGSLPKLNQLYISGERITDAGLAHLKSLRELRYLSVSWTKTTQAGIDALRESLPELRIDHGDF